MTRTGPVDRTYSWQFLNSSVTHNGVELVPYDLMDVDVQKVLAHNPLCPLSQRFQKLHIPFTLEATFFVPPVISRYFPLYQPL